VSERDELRQRLTRIEHALARIEAEFRGKRDLLIAMLGRLAPPPGET
jgi:hypothetical protein